MIKTKKLLLSEIILLIASVFIFRSIWLLADMIPVMHESSALWASLIISIVVVIPALHYVIRYGRQRL